VHQDWKLSKYHGYRTTFIHTRSRRLAYTYVWQSILPQLRSLGHIATAPTLSGLDERSYFACDTIDLKWHIEDVISHIVVEDLRNVTLIGWSYAGMVITGALAQLPDRISKVVYLDAFVPSDGQALIDFAAPPGGDKVLTNNSAKCAPGCRCLLRRGRPFEQPRCSMPLKSDR
jgi:pimeloyl-ACP methyl ester carboxylesterase